MARTKHVDPVDAAFDQMVASRQAQRELTDGAIRCSLDGCGGIVKPQYILTAPDGTQFGLCPQIAVHQALSAAKPELRKRIGRMLQLYKARQ